MPFRPLPEFMYIDVYDKDANNSLLSFVIYFLFFFAGVEEAKTNGNLEQTDQRIQ